MIKVALIVFLLNSDGAILGMHDPVPFETREQCEDFVTSELPKAREMLKEEGELVAFCMEPAARKSVSAFQRLR